MLERHPRRTPGPQPCEASTPGRTFAKRAAMQLPVRFLRKASGMPAGSARYYENGQIGSVLGRAAFGLRRPKGNGSDDNLLQKIRNQVRLAP